MRAEVQKISGNNQFTIIGGYLILIYYIVRAKCMKLIDIRMAYDKGLGDIYLWINVFNYNIN